MTTPRTQAYRRENRCDIDIDQFRMPHGKPLHSSRRLPGQVELGAAEPQMDERLVSMPYRVWERVKAVAAGSGCPGVGDVVTPAEAIALTKALQAAEGAEKDPAVKSAIQHVIQTCQQGKGLRAV